MILQKNQLFVSTPIKTIILTLFLLTVFLQVLKSVSNLYYLFLISVTFLTILIFIVEGRIKTNKNKYSAECDFFHYKQVLIIL